MKNTQPLTYQMSRKAFNTILKTRNGDNAKKNPYVYVMEVINAEYGLRGTVKSIFITEAE